MTDIYDEFQKQIDTLKPSLPLKSSPPSSSQNSVKQSRQGCSSSSRKHSFSAQQQSRSSSLEDCSLSPEGPRFLIKEDSFSEKQRPRSSLRQRWPSLTRERSLSPREYPFSVKEDSFSVQRRPRSSSRQRWPSLTRQTSLSPQGPRLKVQENAFLAQHTVKKIGFLLNPQKRVQRPRSSRRKSSRSLTRDTSLSPQGPRLKVQENAFLAQQRPRSSWRQRSRSLTRDTSLSPEGPRLSVQQHSFPAQRPRSAAQKHSLATSLNAPGPVICVRVNKGTIQVMSGDITAEKVDAIIGSSSSEILKKAIIQVAGNEVWTSYNIQHKNNPNSVLIPTPSGALPCKQIFFVKWQPDKNKKILQQSLVDLIGIVIQYVISYKFKSLAFPALGCGQHGCSVDIIVNTMVKEMKNQLTIRNLPLVVRFVIQPGQQNIYDEFCKQVLATQN
ncbi:unnamed protein product, partial [Rotaria sp. Silwood2]